MDNFPKNIDEEVFNLINNENKRQELGLELIASENYASPAVMKAQGSVLNQQICRGLSV